jgi:hypothetical protein
MGYRTPRTEGRSFAQTPRRFKSITHHHCYSLPETERARARCFRHFQVGSTSNPGFNNFATNALQPV